MFVKIELTHRHQIQRVIQERNVVILVQFIYTSNTT